MSNVIQIETAVKKVLATLNEDSFIYDLLLAYDTPKATVARLQRGSLNMATRKPDVAWKKKLFFRIEKENDLLLTITGLSQSEDVLKFHPRFIVVTDFKQLLAVDTKHKDTTLNIPLNELAVHYSFFLPWAGMEKSAVQVENPADLKAAERMAKLFDEIKRDNPTFATEYVHGLNVFLTRLLFCFFAEDTGIFPQGIFHQTLKAYTQEDGSDLDAFLTRLFAVLNTPESLRGKDLPDYLAEFPYVNGGLFSQQLPLPHFSMRSRNAIIKSGELNWAAINPDIFGSMIQNVVTEEDRGDMGIHYTSVPNIMKVIEPLFLNELYEEFDKACHPDSSIKNSKKYKADRLNALLNRIANIRVFDPACGSGNFLIIAYRELRKLEIEILKQQDQKVLFSRVELRNFYGIEISDFSCEVAMLSLWLAEHQMNMIFKAEFGQCNPTLPLHEAGHIVCNNATRIPWENVCPKNGRETYILGNPPYLGASLQSSEQKEDMEFVFQDITGYKNLDYIACWFFLAGQYIKNSTSSFAFVSTNSICQGEQVAILWPELLKHGHISFAYSSFKWANNAKYNAGVTCVIVGLEDNKNSRRRIYGKTQMMVTDNITPYLLSGNTLIVTKQTQNISSLPEMLYGSKATDGGALSLSSEERDDLLAKYPDMRSVIKRFVGSEEAIKGKDRYCLWLALEDYTKFEEIPEIAERISCCRDFRQRSSKLATRKLADVPYAFGEIRYRKSDVLLIPATSSENREYIPIGFYDKQTVVSNAAHTICDAPLWLFAVITSKMHMVWIRTVCGSLETRIRYSAILGYNTFPFPNISNKQKEELSELARQVLFCREMESEKTLAELYDPNKMPKALKEAHHQLDLAVERCYRSKPFESDEERLEYLFKLYEKMVVEEKK